MTPPRFLIAVLAAVVLAGCGTGEMSMAEYGERIDAAATAASERAAVMVAEAAEVTEPTPEMLAGGLQRGLAEIRIPLQEAVDEIDPPAAIAELHNLMWDWHVRLITVEQEVVVRIRETPHTVEGWTALSDSPEMAAYRATVGEGKAICDEFQARLDATAVAGAFEGTPWTPGEMQEVVEAALGCEWFPDNPEEIYLYPPAG